jgi:hypothetical protein
MHNIQYKRLRANWLFKGCGSHQAPFSLIVDRFGLTNFPYSPCLQLMLKIAL